MEEEAPLVSVIVRTRDRPQLLAEALESLARQTFQDFETVVVNDSDLAPPEQLLARRFGKGIRLVSPGAPHGRARALNAGLLAAAGRYIAYLDDDDLFLPHHIERLLAALAENPGCRCVFSDADLIRQKRLPTGEYQDAFRIPIFGFDFDRNVLLFQNFIPLLCLLHEKTLALEAGCADESFDLFEDWEFLIRMSEKNPFIHVAETTALYRLRDDLTNATMATPWMSAGSESARLAVFTKHFSSFSPETIRAYLNVQERRRENQNLEYEKRIHALTLECEHMRQALSESCQHRAGLEERLRAQETSFLEELNRAKSENERKDREREELLAALSRETAAREGMASQLAEREAVIEQMTQSVAWRLFTPYWKLKEHLKKKHPA